MSDAACKAAICSNKAQQTSKTLADSNVIIGNEDPQLRIKVAEYIINRNEKTLSGALKMIGDA